MLGGQVVMLDKHVLDLQEHHNVSWLIYRVYKNILMHNLAIIVPPPPFSSGTGTDWMRLSEPH